MLFSSFFPFFLYLLQHTYTRLYSLSSQILLQHTSTHTHYVYVTEGANGEGVAIVSSLSSFDREQQKEYLLPIVIKDSGN